MLEGLATPALLGVFAATAVAILVLGTWMTGEADRLADTTGLGEALVGAVLLGAATSLSGTVVSVTTALDGHASLAFSNGVGGIAAQTLFLAIADLVHRRANLEHASADATSLFQASVLMALLTVPLVAYALPEWTFWSVHPASLVLVTVYVASVAVAQNVRKDPMWEPVETADTRADESDEPESSTNARAVAVRFAALMAGLGVAGWVMAETAGRLVERLDMSEALIGALMTAVATSLPELVTTLAAVRRGAMQLAVGGIIGGNTFDMLFLSLSDVAYRDGSLYHAIGRPDLVWIAVGLLMTTILLMGLILRERQGPFRIGTESVLLILVYAGAVAAQLAAG